MSKFYITTAIDYPNSLPHLGTAYEKIGADVLARYHRMLGDSVHFQMGNDEHSVKVKKAALELNLDPKAYCDSMKDKFVTTWKNLGVSFDDFIQTSEPRNKTATLKLFTLLQKKGDVYKGSYEGWYCEGCEAFYLDKDLVDGLCPAHKAKPKWLKEENYFFKLSHYADSIKQHILAHPHFILPEIRRNEILSFIEQGVEDISISRSGSDWGVPVPGDENQFIYVWFDALVNYLAAIKFGEDDPYFKTLWPADIHVIGKDITRFHCIIWPAMLMSAGLPLPKTIFGHGFVYLKGERMSKTLGNIVSPMEIVEKYGPDALRYYLLRESSFGADSNFTWEGFIKRYNSDLANDLGNLLNRTLGMAKKYFDGLIENGRAETDNLDYDLLHRHGLETGKRIHELMNYQNGDLNFHQALASLWQFISQCDKYINDLAPWSLIKQGKAERLKDFIVTLVLALRLIATYIRPFLPHTSDKIFAQLKFPVPQNFSEVETFSNIKLPHQLGEASPLFPRIELEAKT